MHWFTEIVLKICTYHLIGRMNNLKQNFHCNNFYVTYSMKNLKEKSKTSKCKKVGKLMGQNYSLVGFQIRTNELRKRLCYFVTYLNRQQIKKLFLWGLKGNRKKLVHIKTKSFTLLRRKYYFTWKVRG